MEDFNAKVLPQCQFKMFGIDASKINRRLKNGGVLKIVTAAIENQSDFMHISKMAVL